MKVHERLPVRLEPAAHAVDPSREPRPAQDADRDGGELRTDSLFVRPPNDVTAVATIPPGKVRSAENVLRPGSSITYRGMMSTRLPSSMT